MSFYPPDSHLYQESCPQENFTKITEVSVLIDGTAIKQTLPTDPKEVSGNEVQSFVIVNDIDVEEELSKAQKDNTNFFKVLSMSFYSKVKSHSVDNQETRELHRNTDTQKDSLKAMFPRKSSAYTASESKKAHKKAMAKQRTQEALKRTGLPIKDFQIPPERFKKRLMSPKEEAVKAYSPAVTNPQKYQIGNFLGKSLPKRETTMMTVESQTRKEEKEETRSPQKTSASPYLKTQTGRSDSPKFNFKKASSFKIPREQSKPLLNTNKERTDEPSALDIPAQDQDRREKSYDISDNKESKPNSKQSSRRSSTKAGLTGTPNNSGRSLPSATNVQLKNALKKEMKTAFFDQRFKHNFFASSSENNSNATTKKNVEIQRGKKAIKQKGQKASSQDAKAGTRSGERIRNWHMMDLKVPDIKVSVYESEGEKQETQFDKEDLSPQKNHIARSKDRNSSAYKLERQRSPVIGKHNERIPSSGMTTSGIGSWGINDVMIGRESLNIRSGSQKESHNNQSHDTKSQKSSKTSLKESAAKSKTNSTEKLTKSSIYSHMKGGKGSDASPELAKESYSLKHDIYELLKSKDEKALKIFEAYEKRKETREKNRAVSPMLGENNKNPFELYEKLSAHKKISREKF